MNRIRVSRGEDTDGLRRPLRQSVELRVDSTSCRRTRSRRPQGPGNGNPQRRHDEVAHDRHQNPGEHEGFERGRQRFEVRAKTDDDGKNDEKRDEPCDKCSDRADHKGVPGYDWPCVKSDDGRRVQRGPLKGRHDSKGRAFCPSNPRRKSH